MKAQLTADRVVLVTDMSKLYDFLERLKKEKLDFQLSYTDLGYVSVEIDAYSEKWVVEFDNEGSVDIDIYRRVETASPEDESLLENLFSRVQKAWLEAAHDLDFEVIGPYSFRTDDGNRFEASIYLPDFGSTQGTLLFTHTDDELAVDAAHDMGYNLSLITPAYYDHYDRDHFVETLQDWGWSNPKRKPPVWYNKKPEQDNSGKPD